MEVKSCVWISSLLLGFGLTGLIVFDYNSLISDNILIKVQSGSIVFLALLSVTLFFENNKIKLAKFLKIPWVGKFGQLCFVIFILGVISTEVMYIFGSGGFYWPPVFMAALAIGLFFANQAFSRL